MRCGDPTNAKGASGSVEIVRFTLGTDPTARLVDALDGIDFVFHLAAEKHQAEADRPQEILRANVEGTHQLLEAAVARKVRKVVFASSLYTYGRMHGPPFREEDLPAPTTVYGLSKLAGEHLHAHFAAMYGLPYNVLRYLFVYGPRQFAGQGYKSVIVQSTERILAGLGPRVFGDGTQELDYVFVDDVVEASIRALEGAASGEIINIGSGTGTAVNRLVDTLISVSGCAMPKLYEPPDWTAGSSRIADVAKARKLLGWTATTPLEVGLARTFRWLARRSPSSQF
jgi:UDP-glucose 4-epimerase